MSVLNHGPVGQTIRSVFRSGEILRSSFGLVPGMIDSVGLRDLPEKLRRTVSVIHF